MLKVNNKGAGPEEGGGTALRKMGLLSFQLFLQGHIKMPNCFTIPGSIEVNFNYACSYTLIIALIIKYRLGILRTPARAREGQGKEGRRGENFGERRGKGRGVGQKGVGGGRGKSPEE